MTGGGRDVAYTSHLAVRAPAERVFEAIHSLEGLASWWTPHVSGSNEIGGELRFEFEGLTEHVIMRVEEASAPSTLRWTCVTHTGHPEWAGTEPTFAITRTDADTCVIDFVHVGLAPTLGCYEQCERGWDRFLASIVAYAEVGRGMPYGAPPEPVEQLADALTLMEHLSAGIREDQWSSPTPCPDWTVRDLLLHVLAGNRMFASALRYRESQPEEPDPDVLRASRDAASELLAAFRHAGALERTVTLPIGPVPGIVALHIRITELLVHGWDVARATEQTIDFPDDLAEQELTFSNTMLAEIPPDRRPFAPPQPVDDRAPAIERLVACLGRSVDGNT
jgi:uncharacterized protein (TIGR03086 family)